MVDTRCLQHKKCFSFVMMQRNWLTDLHSIPHLCLINGRWQQLLLLNLIFKIFAIFFKIIFVAKQDILGKEMK